MNTGDSMNICPYVPHTFASREKKCEGFIIAVTYTDKISSEIQKELLYYNQTEIYKFLDKKEKNSFSKVSILKYNKTRASKFTNKNNYFLKIKMLAHSKYVESAKSREVEVIKNNSHELQSQSHQYIYILSDKSSIKISNKKFKVFNGDTIYLKPLTKYSFCTKGLKILTIEVEGKINAEVRKQLSQIGKKNLKRIIFDDKQWFKS